jgi:hypothetical protein
MSSERLRQSSKPHLARLAGFYLAVVAFVALWLVIFNFGLAAFFGVWFDPSLVDVHVVHNVTFISLIWVFGLAMLVQLYKPRRRVTAMQMTLLVPIVGLIDMVPQVVLGTLDPMIFVFFAPVFVAAAIHPARDEVFDREQFSRDSLNRQLLGLAALALVPVGLYAIGQLNLQLTLSDEHAAMSHYSSIAFSSVLIVVLAGLASLGGPSRRAAAYAAAFLAFVLAAISTVHPAASAISPLWSGASVLWGFAVVVTYEWSARRTKSDRDDVSVEDPSAAD